MNPTQNNNNSLTRTTHNVTLYITPKFNSTELTSAALPHILEFRNEHLAMTKHFRCLSLLSLIITVISVPIYKLNYMCVARVMFPL